MNKALFLSVVKHRTARLAEALVPPEAGKDALTPDERDIREAYFSIGCGGSRSDYRRKIGAQWANKGKTLNPKVFEAEGDDDFAEVPLEKFTLAAFVPLKNPNGHSYEIGKVSVLVRGDMAYKPDEGDVGNHMASQRFALRAATPDEIETTWDSAKAILHASKLNFNDYDLFDAEDTVENVLAIVEKL